MTIRVAPGETTKLPGTLQAVNLGGGAILLAATDDLHLIGAVPISCQRANGLSFESPGKDDKDSGTR